MNPKQQHILNNIKLLAPEIDSTTGITNWKPVIYGVFWGFNCFPDGQIQAYIHKSFKDQDLVIKARLIDAEVVMAFDQLSCIIDWDRTLPDIITYWYGARSDKEEAGDFLVCNVSENTSIWIGNSDRVKVFYPHSVITPKPPLTPPVISPYHVDLLDFKDFDIKRYDGLIFPDMSAEGRFDEDLRYAGIQIPRYRCLKTRDQVSGEITRHEIPQLPKEGRFLVMDDLCDGGRTFIDIVTLGKGGLGTTFDLFVPHGVFSNGVLGKLQRAGFDNIFTTNSYQDFNLGDDWKMIDEGILHVQEIF